MTYQELCELWKVQGTQFNNWRTALFDQASRLREEVCAAIQLEPDAVWEDAALQKSHRYLEVIQLSEGRERLTRTNVELSINDDNELVFGLRITFESGKDCVLIPMALRFYQDRAEFAFYDAQQNALVSSKSWEPDISQFIAALLARIDEYVRFDPFSGLRSKTSITFV